ncbi:hypothetical protein K2173_025380 [Erythroxylum novogranatense]|uniref:Pentatricopeptide repeat-containing protein n=1 Tax=Erythroxylum novogranatense TaxID=1862640 RepID=A0AAV8UDS5_9ROSI|nr:hypothetical protein K2173_025380 [Erythroxylum novogranatense]
MAIVVSISKQPNLRHIINPASVILRHLSAESAPPAQPPPPLLKHNDVDDSIVTHALNLLLKAPQHEWNTAQLNSVLFPHSSCSSRVLYQITRRLNNSSRALQFLHFLKHNAPPWPDAHFLSSTLQAVLELATREPDSCTKLLELYRTSKDWNIPLTVNAAKLLVRHFGRDPLTEESLLLLREVDASVKNTHVRNFLIEVMWRNGRVDDALKLFEEMLASNEDSRCAPDDVTGSIFSYWFSKAKRPGRNVTEEEVVDVVVKLGEHGVFLSSEWNRQLITRLCRNRMANKAWDLFNQLIKLGFNLQVESCNALLTGLGRNGDIKGMNELMEKMKGIQIKPNVITFGILINQLCKFRRVDDALEVLKQMNGGEGEQEVSIEPDIVIYNTLIDGLCKVGRLEEGVGWMERMRLKGCDPNIVTYNCLIDGFCKDGQLERGLELFDEMNREGGSVVPNVVTVNTLVDGMCRHGRVNSAFEFFGEMQRKGLKGNVVSYTVLINAFCNVNNLDRAMEIFDQMRSGGCIPDALVYYTLISGLSRAGKMDEACSILSNLKEGGYCPDIVCYNDLIGGYCKRMKFDKAYNLFKQMKEFGLKPDSVTYNILISYFARRGDLKFALRLLKGMIKDGVVPTVVTYGALIHAYCFLEKVDKAIQIFKDMDATSKVVPNTVIYNILIESLCKHNHVELALSLFDDMKVKRVRPNTTTYNAIFKGLKEKRWLKTAFELMDKMIGQSCHPDYITLEILTEWLPAVGEAEKLRNFVQGYRTSPDAAKNGFVEESI